MLTTKSPLSKYSPRLLATAGKETKGEEKKEMSNQTWVSRHNMIWQVVSRSKEVVNTRLENLMCASLIKSHNIYRYFSFIRLFLYLSRMFDVKSATTGDFHSSFDRTERKRVKKVLLCHKI